MPTIEERLQALEQENAPRKKTEELLTIAVRALVSTNLHSRMANLQDCKPKCASVSQNIRHYFNKFSHGYQSRTKQASKKIKTVGLHSQKRMKSLLFSLTIKIA